MILKEARSGTKICHGCYYEHEPGTVTAEWTLQGGRFMIHLCEQCACEMRDLMENVGLCSTCEQSTAPDHGSAIQRVLKRITQGGDAVL